jgi:hypothetical protein
VKNGRVGEKIISVSLIILKLRNFTHFGAHFDPLGVHIRGKQFSEVSESSENELGRVKNGRYGGKSSL